MPPNFLWGKKIGLRERYRVWTVPIPKFFKIHTFYVSKLTRVEKAVKNTTIFVT